MCLRAKRFTVVESLQQTQKPQHDLQNQKATCNTLCKFTKHLNSKVSKLKNQVFVTYIREKGRTHGA